ncbi:unnamed protein product [Mytilus coruscus]|uniref:MAM domain-containing protein n=1 Tax=Mytilus coruscus TaxID=42192 RepID=A0A6J8ANJ8_MYTCO|nr:unnamed protein product [Mytilus coruscus]
MIWIVLMMWLPSKLFIFFSVIHLHSALEYTVVVDANKDPSSLNCSEDAFITIMDVSVKSEGYCKSASCIIDNSDHVVLRRLCENSTNCLIYGSNFSSACLLEQRRFDLSYLCEAPISLDCSFESDLLCHWEQGTDDDFDWTRHSGKTHTGNTGPDSDHTTNSIHGNHPENTMPNMLITHGHGLQILR